MRKISPLNFSLKYLWISIILSIKLEFISSSKNFNKYFLLSKKIKNWSINSFWNNFDWERSGLVSEEFSIIFLISFENTIIFIKISKNLISRRFLLNKLNFSKKNYFIIISILSRYSFSWWIFSFKKKTIISVLTSFIWENISNKRFIMFKIIK